jgi:hypothetical protein
MLQAGTVGTLPAEGGAIIFSSTGAPLTTLVGPADVGATPTFITNYSPDGTSVAYAVTISSNVLVFPTGLTVTADGGFAVVVIVTGRGINPARLPAPITATDATAPGTPLVKPLSQPQNRDPRVAVVRYSAEGRPLWIATIVDIGDSAQQALSATDITTDAAGNVVVAVGYDTGSQVPGIAVSDGTQSGTATSFGIAASGYVLKFASANGALIPGGTNAGATLLASNGAGFLVGLAPSAMDAGVFVSGSYSSATAVISSGDGTSLAPVPNSGASFEALLTRLDGGLNGVWATHMGGTDNDVAAEVA